MTEDTDNLVLEHLRAIRGDLRAMIAAMSGMHAEVIATRRHLESHLNQVTLPERGSYEEKAGRDQKNA